MKVSPRGFGHSRIEDCWLPDVYIVVYQPNSGIPVFEIVREDGTPGKKVLHRNLLLPISSVPIATSDSVHDTVRVGEGVKVGGEVNTGKPVAVVYSVR